MPDQGNIRLRNLEEPIKFTNGSTKGYVDNAGRRLEQLSWTRQIPTIKFLEGFVFNKSYTKKLTMNAVTTDLKGAVQNHVRLVGVEVSKGGNLKLGFDKDTIGSFER